MTKNKRAPSLPSPYDARLDDEDPTQQPNHRPHLNPDSHALSQEEALKRRYPVFLPVLVHPLQLPTPPNDVHHSPLLHRYYRPKEQQWNSNPTPLLPNL